MGFGAELPESIGGYTVERQLGAGGMGTVYLARSRGGRAVAVKVVRPELAGDPHFRARFRAEVAAARKVGGFHTAQVVDADPDADEPWLATAYVAGPTLSGLLAEQGPMDGAGLRGLGAALAEGLQAIHACGLVHRDLKPGNIVMAADGPRVLDFGIARAVESTRLTSTGAAFGTPGFLAPEQAQGLEVTGAADVFALGAVLVAAAGGSAFGDGTPVVLMYRSVHEAADVSAVPEDLRGVVSACLSKDPGRRPSPDDLLDRLTVRPPAPPAAPAAAVHGRPTMPAGPPPDPAAASGPAAPAPLPDLAAPSAPSARRPRGRRLVTVLTAAAVVTALVGGAVYLEQRNDGKKTSASSAPSTSKSPQAPNPQASSPPGPSRTKDTAKDTIEDDAKDRDKVTVLVNIESGKTWISVKNSQGRLLFDGIMAQGETKTFTDTTYVDLVLGDASAVELTVNGKRIQDDFQPGQVERLRYTPGD